MGINIRSAKRGGGWDGRGWVSGWVGEEAKALYKHFGVVVATWCRYKSPTMSRRHSWSNGSSFK